MTKLLTLATLQHFRGTFGTCGQQLTHPARKATAVLKFWRRFIIRVFGSLSSQPQSFSALLLTILNLIGDCGVIVLPVKLLIQLQ